MTPPNEDWTPRPNLTRRFWVGCVVMLFSISLLIVTALTYDRTVSGSIPWGQPLITILMFAFGARFALSNGNLAALKARLL